MKDVKSEDILSLEIFDSIKKETVDGLVRIGRKKDLKKGEHLFRDREHVEYVYVVLSGKVSLYKLNESANKKIVFILGKNKVINAVILEDFKASINCEVFEKAEVLLFNRREFAKLMESDFELTKVVINSLAIKVRRLYRQMKNSVPIKFEKRVAAKLWKLAKDYGVDCKEGTQIDLNLSITYFADMFGAPRETISRAVNVLQKEELIKVVEKKFIIKDKDKLAAYFKGIEEK